MGIIIMSVYILVFITVIPGSKCIMQIREVFEISDYADGL